MLVQHAQFHSPTVVPAVIPPQLIRSTDDLDDLIERTSFAQKEYADFSQEQVDKIFRSVAMAANAARLSLAKQAVAETGMGVVEDKVIKKHFAAEFIYNRFKHTKTCGVIEWDEVFGIRKIAEPLGILAGIIPTTNPTSTTIFKGLLALKTRNAIVFSPHPRAIACTVEAARILMHAAREAGAPDGIIMTLATGGPGMVQAAYSSGKPAIGPGEPLSCEKLSPVLSMYRATDFTVAMHKAQKLLGYGGMGHTAVLYTDPTNRQRIERFSEYVSTARVLINQPSSGDRISKSRMRPSSSRRWISKSAKHRSRNN